MFAYALYLITEINAWNTIVNRVICACSTFTELKIIAQKAIFPRKTLDSHICCLLDPELSIFLPDKNVYFFLLWQGLSLPGIQVPSGIPAYCMPVARFEISTVSQSEELSQLKITE